MLSRDSMADSSEEGRLAPSLSSMQFIVPSSQERKLCNYLRGGL